MADTKVSALAAATAFLPTHELPVNEAGTSKKVTGTQIRARRNQNLPFAATLTPNLSLGDLVNIGALTGNITTMNTPTGASTGVTYYYQFTQDGTGGRTVSWGAFYVNPPQPRAGANAVSLIGFMQDSNGNHVYVSGP